MSPRLRAVTDAIEAGVVLLDGHGRAEFASPAALRLLGADGLGALRERWPAELIPDERPSGDHRAVDLRDLELKVGDHVHALRARFHALGEDGARGHLLVLWDRRRIEALESDLERANQMSAFLHLFRELAHDLRAPLNAVQLNLDLLREELADAHVPPRPDTRSPQETLEIVQREVARLGRSLGQFFSGSMPRDTGADTRFELRRLLREIATLVRPQARACGIRVRTDLPHEAVSFVGYRDRLKQALLNVVLNAVEVMSGGGELDLTLRREGDEVRIDVRDRGPGLPPDAGERPFELYYTTKEGGSGIGLHVARSIVRGHGGTLTLENAEGGGARAIVRLPWPRQEPRDSAGAAPHRAP